MAETVSPRPPEPRVQFEHIQLEEIVGPAENEGEAEEGTEELPTQNRHPDEEIVLDLEQRPPDPNNGETERGHAQADDRRLDEEEEIRKGLGENKGREEEEPGAHSSQRDPETGQEDVRQGFQRHALKNEGNIAN